MISLALQAEQIKVVACWLYPTTDLSKWRQTHRSPHRPHRPHSLMAAPPEWKLCCKVECKELTPNGGGGSFVIVPSSQSSKKTLQKNLAEPIEDALANRRNAMGESDGESDGDSDDSDDEWEPE
jgi:hypothetical protein